MLRATTVIRKAAVKAERVADTVTLDHGQRSGSRIALSGEGGLDFLLDLDQPTVLNDGDAVKLSDGRLVRIRAAAQPLLEIRAEKPLRLMRLAWQLGGRHVTAEIAADAIYVEDDPALAEMVRGQGCSATSVQRPFHPERAEHDCSHDHGHSHGDAHGHSHGHSHHGSGEAGHVRGGHAHGHDHAAGHGHGHDPVHEH